MGKIINIAVRDLIAKNPRQNEYEYVCGNSGFTVVFDFDEDWNEFDTKTARFEWNGKHQDVVFNGNQCEVPSEISDTNVVQVGVYTGNLHTTTPAVVLARKSILCGSGLPADPPPDVYKQIMQKLQDIEVGCVKPFPVNDEGYVEILKLKDSTFYYLDNVLEGDTYDLVCDGYITGCALVSGEMYFCNRDDSTRGERVYLYGNNCWCVASPQKNGGYKFNWAANQNYLSTRPGNNSKYGYEPHNEYCPTTVKWVNDAISSAVGGITIPEQVQADWNQNGPSSKAYIKNRPFWVEAGASNVLEWDGDTTGMTSFSPDGSVTLYKVSDYFAGSADLVGGAFTVTAEGQTMDIPITDSMVTGEAADGFELCQVTYESLLAIVTINQDLTMEGLTLEKGTYLLSMGAAAGYISKLTAVNAVFGSGEGETVHQLDPKFIPTATADTIGGVKVGDGLTVDGDGVLEAEQYRLIESITLEEDSTVIRTEEPDGTPYNFKKLKYRVIVPNTNTLTAYVNTVIYSDTGNLVVLYTNITKNALCGVWGEVVKIGEMWDAFYTFNSGGSSYAYLSDKAPKAFGSLYEPNAFGNSIAQFAINVAIPAGTTVQIWGVRA